MPEEEAAGPEGPQVKVKQITVEKPIRYYGMDEVVPVFAELAAVRHSEQYFSLFFYHTVVPITDDMAVLEAMPEVPAKCIAKIILTPKLMVDLHNAMRTNMDNWRQLIQIRMGEEALPEKAEEQN